MRWVNSSPSGFLSFSVLLMTNDHSRCAISVLDKIGNSVAMPMVTQLSLLKAAYHLIRIKVFFNIYYLKMQVTEPHTACSPCPRLFLSSKKSLLVHWLEFVMLRYRLACLESQGSSQNFRNTSRWTIPVSRFLQLWGGLRIVEATWL